MIERSQNQNKGWCNNLQPIFNLSYIWLVSVACWSSCIKYIQFFVMRLSLHWTIYFSYFIFRFLFFLSIFLDFTKIPKLNSIFWGVNRVSNLIKNEIQKKIIILQQFLLLTYGNSIILLNSAQKQALPNIGQFRIEYYIHV